MSTPERTDELLMRELCLGDRGALAELVGRYQADIFRFCVHYLRDPGRAEEVAQETFVRVYTARERFDVSRRFKPWVLCIARNLCLNELKRKRAVPMASLESYLGTAHKDGEATLATKAEQPDQTAMAAERRALLAKALEGLDDGSRELVILRFFERMPARDIAQVFDTTEGAIRTRLHRVLKRLRDDYRDVRDDL